MPGRQITQTFFALAPNGVVHKVATVGINEIRAMQKFARMSEIHSVEVLMAVQVDHLKNSKVLALGRAVEHEIQYALPDATGEIVVHEGLSAFFETIGYDAAAKRRCTAQQRKFDRASIGPNGELTWPDPNGFRVVLQGSVT